LLRAAIPDSLIGEFNGDRTTADARRDRSFLAVILQELTPAISLTRAGIQAKRSSHHEAIEHECRSQTSGNLPARRLHRLVRQWVAATGWY